jgi:UrcA family protein
MAMMKNRIALLGCAMAMLLCGAGLARAQDYDSRYDRPYYADPGYVRSYDRPYSDTAYYRYEDPGETVIVHPDYDRVEKQQLLGHINGEVNPVELSISRPVSFSDLNLSREADYIELRERVRDTAQDLCAELDARYPDLRGDASADRECVRNATRNAMREVDRS